MLASPAKGQNVSVTDYSVPVSRANNLRIDGLTFNFVNEGNKVRVETGSAGLIFKKFYTSLPFAYSIDMAGTASYNREPSGNRIGTFSTTIKPRIQKYLWKNIFIVDDIDFALDKEFDWPGIDMTIGFGYGRFINATALRKTVRIEDFFLKEGIISDHLPKKTMVELGHIIEKKNEYENLYGTRYENYWYEDMSNEITKSGLVLGSIGAIGVLRIQEVLFQERINDRFYGWDFTTGIQFQLVNPEKEQPRPSPAMSVNLRYSRPISWRTQINTDLKLHTPFSKNFGREYNFSNETDFIYEITNKISFTAFHLFRVRKPKNMDARFITALTFSFNFFIENKISLTASEQINKSEGLPYRQSFALGINYRIF